MTLAGLVITVLLCCGVAAGVISLVLGHWNAWRFLGRTHEPTPPLPNPPPKVSILKPIEGTGRGTAEALESFCRLDYPGPVEILVGTLSEDDAIVPIVEQLRRAHPDVGLHVVVARLKGANRKTSIMETLWRGASGELLFFSDADVHVQADYLRRLVPLFSEPDTGCVTCLPRGVRAETLGARLVAAHYAFTNLPQWMLATTTTGIHWAIGHTMAVPRHVLERLKGFSEFLDQLADDYELGNRVHRLGFRVLLPPLLLNCAMPGENLQDACRRLIRWKRTMRRARGLAFLGSGLTYPLCWALLLLLVRPLAIWAWILFIGVIALRLLLAALVQLRLQLPSWRRSWWLLPLFDLLEGWSFLAAYTGNQVHWAGRPYRLDRNGTLSPTER